MKKPNPFNQAFIAAFLVIGAVAISAVAFKYSGDISLKFGSDGIQLQVTGTKSNKGME